MMFALIAAGATATVGAAETILAVAELVTASSRLLIAIHPLVECIQNKKMNKDEN